MPDEKELPAQPFFSIEPYLEARRQKMAEDERPAQNPCDVDDLLCQMQVIAHLKGLKGALGEDRFKTDFPELQGLDEKISSRASELRKALGKCGLEPVIEAEEVASEEAQKMESPQIEREYGN